MSNIINLTMKEKKSDISQNLKMRWGYCLLFGCRCYVTVVSTFKLPSCITTLLINICLTHIFGFSLFQTVDQRVHKNPMDRRRAPAAIIFHNKQDDFINSTAMCSLSCSALRLSCMCVSVCVCVRERERTRETEMNRQQTTLCNLNWKHMMFFGFNIQATNNF